METHYQWTRTNVLGMSRFCREHRDRILCAQCDSVMIDTLGRIRTKEHIWQYRRSGSTLGFTHQGCAYGREMPDTDAHNSRNWGKPPTEWTLQDA